MAAQSWTRRKVSGHPTLWQDWRSGGVGLWLSSGWEPEGGEEKRVVLMGGGGAEFRAAMFRAGDGAMRGRDVGGLQGGVKPRALLRWHDGIGVAVEDEEGGLPGSTEVIGLARCAGAGRSGTGPPGSLDSGESARARPRSPGDRANFSTSVGPEKAQTAWTRAEGQARVLAAGLPAAAVDPNHEREGGGGFFRQDEIEVWAHVAVAHRGEVPVSGGFWATAWGGFRG